MNTLVALMEYYHFQLYRGSYCFCFNLPLFSIDQKEWSHAGIDPAIRHTTFQAEEQEREEENDCFDVCAITKMHRFYLVVRSICFVAAIFVAHLKVVVIKEKAFFVEQRSIGINIAKYTLYGDIAVLLLVESEM